MSKQSIYVKHKDDILQELVESLEGLLSIGYTGKEKHEGYIKGLKFCLGLNKTQEEKDQEFAKSIDELKESKK